MNLIEQAKNYLFSRRTSYIKTFLSPFGYEVLADLSKFCRANTTTFHPDPRVHALAEGRREVWLRIQQHLQLTEDDLWKIYGINNQSTTKD